MKLIIYGDIEGSGGYTHYCKGLLSSKSIPDNIEIWFVCSTSFFELLAPLDSRVRVITHKWLASRYRILRYLWHLWKYPKIVRRVQPDVEFYLNGRPRVYFRNAFVVTTCHNLLLFDISEISQIEDIAEQRYFLEYRKNQIHFFNRSDAIIYLSNYSRDVVSKQLRCSKRNIVIPHGLDQRFILDHPRSYEFSNTIELLYVSPYYHYKHQIEVVKALNLIRKSTGLNICLKLIGGGSRSYALKLKETILHEQLERYVTMIGNIKHGDLIKEYQSADIFVFASSCETFGITLLEAMGSRLPIACSNRTGLYDILKDAGLYFNPEDVRNISEIIEELILNIELRQKLGELAYAFAKHYTWERCALETFQYLKTVRNVL